MRIEGCRVYSYSIPRLTQREPESRESWKAIDNVAADHFKQSMFSEWDFGAGEAIKTSTKVFKVRTFHYLIPTMLKRVVWYIFAPGASCLA